MDYATKKNVEQVFNLSPSEFMRERSGIEFTVRQLLGLIDELEAKIAFVERCKEIGLAALPQDGSRGQANAWDALIAQIATLEARVDELKNHPAPDSGTTGR